MNDGIAHAREAMGRGRNPEAQRNNYVGKPQSATQHGAHHSATHRKQRRVPVMWKLVDTTPCRIELHYCEHRPINETRLISVVNLRRCND
ncbi:unnamed protein product [Toxocara canis]|uniref:Uncharacterized protein n=1 Tax=Toxocara canis TaxID=6265 RepID=A0A183TVB3_TOXCA|nr:unnamed protein product [Toxocara canis]